MADDQVLEFAYLKLKDGLAPTDERLVKFLQQCLAEIQDAGGEHFRFLLSSPGDDGPREQLLGMTGIWPTDELHTKFLERGAIMSLLIELGDLLTMKGAVYLNTPNLSPAQTEILSARTTTALFHVGGAGRRAFEETTRDVVGTKPVLAAWNVTDQASHAKSREFCKDIMDADQEELQHGGTWGIVVKAQDRGLVAQLQGKTAGEVEGVEVVTWDAIAV
ncbi:hypothetical protein BDV95DRAFT_612010 [Massariosphaeria phaeospora]|uniref:Uncharacterized protein n=1 Tax=Massariosphaeria phaeospora TaxID=100035 RepID=A0A7C8M2Y3_9PLEO|nr:hypothetical protein BDV95DRAFT_612010 [Massariosphaeria phaeospora]